MASAEGHLYKGEIKDGRENAEELENTTLSYRVYHIMRNCYLRLIVLKGVVDWKIKQ